MKHRILHRYCLAFFEIAAQGWRTKLPKSQKEKFFSSFMATKRQFGKVEFRGTVNASQSSVSCIVRLTALVKELFFLKIY